MMPNLYDHQRAHERRIQELEREHALWHDAPPAPPREKRRTDRGRPIARLGSLLRATSRPAPQRT